VSARYYKRHFVPLASFNNENEIKAASSIIHSQIVDFLAVITTLATADKDHNDDE